MEKCPLGSTIVILILVILHIEIRTLRESMKEIKMSHPNQLGPTLTTTFKLQPKANAFLSIKAIKRIPRYLLTLSALIIITMFVKLLNKPKPVALWDSKI